MPTVPMTARALIVEDEPADRKVIEHLLEERRIDYDYTDDVIQAGKWLEQRKYDLIILDLQLRGGHNDGQFILSIMSQRKKEVPTIVVSTYANQAAARRLRVEFPFVLEVLPKDELADLVRLFYGAIDRALKPSRQRKSGRPDDSNERAPSPTSTILQAATLITILLLSVFGILMLAKNLGQSGIRLDAVLALVLLIIIVAASSLFGRGRMREASVILRQLFRRKP
jgi:DNA-binding NtrC family response regulator